MLNNIQDFPLVSIIIPHYGGVDIINECLQSLSKIKYPQLEILVVDNKSPDHSIDFIKNNYSEIRLLESDYNRGFAGGCNYGAKFAKGKYLVILNNDTIHEAEWLNHLVNKMEENNNISSIQPKIKNYNNRTKFDYAGGSGGYMDKYCSPFARGRVFNTIEEDLGQYDEPCKIFWASGTAFLTKKIIFDELNGFDETLFAHMEEIDYHWKCQYLGYEVWVEPKSVIYHHGAITLPVESQNKTYLNYRNSLILLLTNYPTKVAIKLFFPRIFMEFISLIKELVILRWKHGWAIIRAWLWILTHINFLLERKKKLKNKYPIYNIYNKSIVLDYYFLRKKTYTDIIK